MAGFTLEPRPGLEEDGEYELVWMMARRTCAHDADIHELVQNVMALLEPHGGMIWELGTCSDNPGEPVPPRYYEMMTGQIFVRTDHRARDH